MTHNSQLSSVSAAMEKPLQADDDTPAGRLPPIRPAGTFFSRLYLRIWPPVPFAIWIVPPIETELAEYSEGWL